MKTKYLSSDFEAKQLALNNERNCYLRAMLSAASEYEQEFNGSRKIRTREEAKQFFRIHFNAKTLVPNLYDLVDKNDCYSYIRDPGEIQFNWDYMQRVVSKYLRSLGYKKIHDINTLSKKDRQCYCVIRINSNYPGAYHYISGTVDYVFCVWREEIRSSKPIFYLRRKEVAYGPKAEKKVLRGAYSYS